MSGNGYSDPETYLANYGLPVAGAGANVYQFGSAYRYTESQWLNWIFWGKCLRDLSVAHTLFRINPDMINRNR